MEAYSGLSREELIARLAFTEAQLKKVSFSVKEKEGIRAGERQSDLPMAVVGPDGKISYANGALYRMNGFLPEEIIGFRIADFIEEKNKAWDREMFGKMLAGESNMFRGEHYFRVKCGARVCLDVLVMAVRSETGSFRHATYIFNDITENKRNERELIDLLDTQNRIAHSLILMMEKETGAYENDILRIILDRYAADRAYIFQFDWEEDTCSNIYEVTAGGIEPEIEKLQHLPNRELEGALSMFRQRKPFIVNELGDAGKAEEFSRIILEEQHIQSAILFPIFIIDKLWGYLGLDMVRSRKTWNTDEIDWLESFTGILSVGLTQKLTQDLLVSQKRTFDMILDSGSLGYWKFDVTTGILECSDSYFNMLGYISGEWPHTLESVWKLVHPEDLLPLQNFFREKAAGLNSGESWEFRLKKSSGEWLWVLSKIIREEYNEYTGSRIITGINVNIDESKRSALDIREKDLLIRRNERKLRTIFENLPVGIVVYDEQGNYFDSNDELLAIFGCKDKSEIADVNILNNLHRYENWQQRGLLSFEFEYDRERRCVVTGDKDRRKCLHSLYLSGKIVPLSDDSDRITGYLLIIVNNTEMRKAARQLREKELLWSQVADFSRIYTWKYNVRTADWYISDEIYFCYGMEYGSVSKNELVASCILRIRENVRKKLLKKWKESIAGEENVPYEFSFALDTDKEQVYNTIRWVKKKEVDGEFIYGITVDVSELMRAQRALKENLVRLSLVMDSGSLIPWYLDLRTQRLELGDEFFRIFPDRRSHAHQYTLSDFINRLHPEEVSSFRAELHRLQKGLTERLNMELRVDVSGNRYVWCELNAAIRERGQQNEIVKLLGFITVIQKRKDTELKLREAMEKAEESDRLKSAFLANISHEIRTPLNAIVGFSELIAHSEEEEEKENFLNIVKTNNGVLLNLINDILDLSRIESGRMDLKESWVNVRTLCRELCEVHQLKAAGGVGVVFASADVPLVMYTDRNRLHQLYSNLISNAIKNTKEGTITIGYEVKGDEVECWVRDTGIGMPPDKVDTIFNRFEKLDTNNQGFGLGLSICKSILERMGGRIRVESELGKGSEFRFVLPCRGEKNILPTASETGTAFSGRETSGSACILAAVNNDAVYSRIEAAIGEKYLLLRAGNGLEAVGLFSEERPHIVLMDMELPEMNGLEATGVIRELSASVPIIAMTDFRSGYTADEAVKAGCNDFIAKPVNPDGLSILIEKYAVKEKQVDF